MIMKLTEVADIQIGYQHRDKSCPITMGSVGSRQIIQIKDLDLEGRFREVVMESGGMVPYVWTHSLYRVTPPGKPERYLVNKGDVLFLSRGVRTLAVPIVKVLENIIAAYYFYILRPVQDCVTNEYLAWYINQPTAQAFLERRQRGSAMKMIPKHALEELHIAVPSLKTQDSIVQIERLRQKEEFLMGRLAHKRKRMTDAVSIRAAADSTSENIR